MHDRPSPQAPIWRRLLPWIGGLAALAVAVAPIVWGGFPRGHDWPHELVRLAQYRVALAEGQIPPAWAPDLYGGLGSPIFLFYAPLFALLTTALRAVAGPLIGSVAVPAAVVLFLATLLGGLGVALLVHELARDGTGGRRWGAAERLALVLFVLQPYVLADALVRNANAEYLALCLLPLPLAAVAAAGRRPRTAILGLGAGLCLVVLAHNLTALVALVLIAGWSVVLYSRGPLRAWAAVAGGCVFGLALSAWFWLPALALGRWVRREELLGGHLDFRRNFLAPAQLFDGSAFYSAGPLAAILLALALWAVAGGRLAGRRRTVVWAALAGALLLGLAMLPVAEPLWKAVPWLPLFQFPWRLMGPFSLLLAVAGGLVLGSLGGGAESPGRTPDGTVPGWIEGAILLLAAVNALPVLLLVRPLPKEVSVGLEQTLKAREVRRFGHRGTVGDEYVPPGAELSLWHPGEPVSPVLAAPVGFRADATLDRGTELTLLVDAPSAGELVLGRWYFPGWQARIDGHPTAVARSPAGAVAVSVPPGGHRVELRYRPPASRRAGLTVSGASAVVLAGLALAWRRGARR